MNKAEWINELNEKIRGFESTEKASGFFSTEPKTEKEIEADSARAERAKQCLNAIVNDEPENLFYDKISEYIVFGTGIKFN